MSGWGSPQRVAPAVTVLRAALSDVPDWGVPVVMSTEARPPAAPYAVVGVPFHHSRATGRVQGPVAQVDVYGRTDLEAIDLAQALCSAWEALVSVDVPAEGSAVRDGWVITPPILLAEGGLDSGSADVARVMLQLGCWITTYA